MLRSDDSAFSSGSPFTRWARLSALALFAAVLALGCKPQIGDDCSVSTNCSTTGLRLCDVTQPGGYCTIFNCEPGSCPDEAVCVNFGTSLSPVEGCQPSQGNSPYKRSFCMASCGEDNDCRGGYKCLAPSDFKAVAAEHSSGHKVCAVPPPEYGHPELEQTGSKDVCVGSDGGPGPAQGGSSSTGGGGGGGSSDAGEAGSSSPGAGAGGAAGDGGASSG